MNKQRPVAVLVIAILNFVWGSFQILGPLCGIGGLLLGMAMIPNLPANHPVRQLLEESVNIINREVPLFIPYLIVGLVMSLIMGVILVVAGIGLVKMKSWGRSLAIFYGIVAILFTVGECTFSIAVLGPQMPNLQKAIDAKTEEIARKAKASGQPVQANPFQQMIITTANAIIEAVIQLAYPIVVLIIMFLPNVSAAFRNGGMSAGPPPDDRYGDYPQDRYYDDGYN